MDKKLYTQELKNALLKVSDNKLKKEIAQKIAEEYVRQLDFTDHTLMCIGVTSVAKDLMVHIKSEHFSE